jgi:hypothetical protein
MGEIDELEARVAELERRVEILSREPARIDMEELGRDTAPARPRGGGAGRGGQDQAGGQALSRADRRRHGGRDGRTRKLRRD